MDNAKIFDIIRTHAYDEYKTGDNAAVLAVVNTKTIEKTNDTRRDVNWIIASAGLDADEARTVLGTLQAATDPLVVAAERKLASAGVSLADPLVQVMVPQLATAAGWPDGLAEKITAQGKWMESPAEDQLGRDVVLTQQQVDDAITWRKNFLRLNRNFNNAVDQLHAGTITTYAEVLAVMNEDPED